MTKLHGRKADETSHFSWAADTDALPTCAKISCDSYSSTPQLYYFLMNKFPHNHGMKYKKKLLFYCLCHLGIMRPYLLSLCVVLEHDNHIFSEKSRIHAETYLVLLDF